MNLKSKQFQTIVSGKLSSFNAKDLNVALREWKKYQKVNRISESLFENSEYVKPSKKRRQMRNRAIRKNEIAENNQ